VRYHVTICEVENKLFLEQWLNNFPWPLSPLMAELIYGLRNDAVSNADKTASDMTIREK
jgi:hypothetical protein